MSDLDIRLDPEAKQLLRHAASRAAAGPVGARHLRDAMEQPATTQHQPTVVRMDLSLQQIVKRAADLAAEAGMAVVGRRELQAALAEASALGLGLDVAALRFARWRAEQQYPEGAKNRHC